MTLATTLTPATGLTLFERWTALWNGDFSEPESFLAPDFRVRFGSTPESSPDTDGLRGPAGMVDMIARHRATHPGRRYALEGTPSSIRSWAGSPPAGTWPARTGPRRAASTCSRWSRGASRRCGR